MQIDPEFIIDDEKKLANREQRLPDRFCVAWNNYEEKKLIANYKRGKSFHDMSLYHKRTQGSMISKLCDLGVFNNNEREVLNNANKIAAFKKYNIDCFWYISSINNILSILRYGILSRNKMIKNNIQYTDISDPTTQNYRKKPNTNYYNLDLYDCVPLYFSIKNPMLYLRRASRNELCLIEIDISVINEDRFLITDGNAANLDTKFFFNIDQLDNLPWNVLGADWWTQYPDGKRKRMCEILIPLKVKPELINALHFYSDSFIEEVDMRVIDKLNKKVKISKEYFF